MDKMKQLRKGKRGKTAMLIENPADGDDIVRRKLLELEMNVMIKRRDSPYFWVVRNFGVVNNNVSTNAIINSDHYKIIYLSHIPCA